MLRRHACLVLLASFVMICTAERWPVTAAAGRPADRLDRLRVLQDDQYPQAFFFRASEGFARAHGKRRMSLDQWEAIFARLMGIEGKALDEEVTGTSRVNIEWFTRFKQRHPQQLVLLHYNGNARDPRFEREPFFAGHWLYHGGTTVTADVPAEPGQCDIHVTDPTLFYTEMGRYRTSNEDVVLCELGADGKPDWFKAEQVRLVAVDRPRKVIRVERGCYGTGPRAFKAGKAYAAAHVTEGPWGKKNNLMWYYNYSTRCPRDADGRTCGEVHAAELSARFAEGGELAALDGLEFDVLSHYRGGGRRGLDADGDGEPDNHVFDGVNTYGLGVLQFLERLRRQVGEDRLILADGHGSGHQRGFGILNGIESEGWPALQGWHMDDWSGGLNRHAFWAARARKPAFNYINHKYIEPIAGVPGGKRRPDYPFGINRLVFAAAAFTDSAVCFSTAPLREKGERFSIWDELDMGVENRLGWLGAPEGPAVHLAHAAADVLGTADGWMPEVLERLEGEGMSFEVMDGTLKVQATNPDAKRIAFRLKGLNVDGPELVATMVARARPIPPFPESMPRLTYVGIVGGGRLIDDPDELTTGMQRRGKPVGPTDPASGAFVRYVPRLSAGNERKQALQVHPPYRNGKTGMTFWQTEASVPARATLQFFTGMGKLSPERSDGVVFGVEIAPAGEDQPQEFERIFSHTQKAYEWVRHRVDLAKWAGQKVRLRFIADAGPNDRATTDHAAWGEVRILTANQLDRDVPLRPTRLMTWTDTRPFRSDFYFRGLSTPVTALRFEFEGSQPVFLERLSAHARPDLAYRLFEYGMVLANPSDRPATFDLDKLTPGRRYRRLRGSPRQDPQTNNGQPVGKTVTIPPLDALFLVRVTD